MFMPRYFAFFRFNFALACGGSVPHVAVTTIPGSQTPVVEPGIFIDNRLCGASYKKWC
jgi:hypothetical protein